LREERDDGSVVDRMSDGGAATVEFLRGAGRIAMAHRGFTAFRFPMNTMGAFHEAANLGFRYVETDVRATHDGVAVILHDRGLPPTSGPPGAIDRLPWRDVRTADLGAGQSVPTLEELLAALPAIRINIDIKAESAIEPTVDVIERLNAHNRVLVTSFSDRGGVVRYACCRNGSRVRPARSRSWRWWRRKLRPAGHTPGGCCTTVTAYNCRRG
jgi:glycerophosphoryl diester phosphodiesterase